MIDALISSRTRVKLLLKFFLNSNTTAYLRGLETEFGESSNAIRLELNRLEEAGMLVSHLDGNKKVFQANTLHPLFREVHNILRKHLGLDQIVENVVERLGDVEQVYLVGDFAHGRDSKIIDLVFIGKVDKSYLLRLVERAEEMINRKIRYLIYESDNQTKPGWADANSHPLLLWSKTFSPNA
jgi:hypothetical protein